jgi:PPM family protein phosphatase
MLRVAEEFHATHTGQQRRANEDAMFARAPLFAVADGMGGAQAGEIASRIAVETLGGGVRDPDATHTVEERLADLVREANERIHELSRSDDRRAGMGTTMTAALVGQDEVTIAHVGDSRAYLLREGSLSRLTRDHSLVEELVQQGKLTPEEASTHPQRSVITRAVGPEARVEVDTHTSGARSGDVFLICSDGLTTMVDEERIEQLITGSASLRDAGHALIDAANAAGGRDNITVVLFRLEDVARGTAAGAAHATDEQATGVHEAVSPPATTEQRQAASAGGVSTLERERDARPSKPLTRRLQPIAPPEDGDEEQPGRRGRLRRLFVVLAVTALIAVPVGFGGLIALRSVYFVGTGDQGFVTVFRGLPYDLPFGIELYQENYVSPIPREQVPAGRRAAVTDQKLRSQDDAYDLVRQLELGQLRGTR